MLAPCAILLLSLLPGCDVADQKVYGPATVVPGNNDNPQAPMATFQKDAATTTNAVAVSAHAYSADDLWLNAEALWTSHPMDGNDHPTSVDLLLRIDPGSNPEVLEADGLGSWCGGSALQVVSTGNPGEWRIQRSPGSQDCSCVDPWADYGAFNYRLGGVRLKIHTPGQWRVEVAPASSTPFCECEQGCFTGLSYFGGTLTVPSR
jgi:hypothetical protein